MSHSIDHIFYIDDDSDDQDFFLMALLEVKPSATLHSFYSCDKILTYLKGEKMPFPDIIFIEQNINGNIGNECLREMKKITRIEQVPVIIYTTGGTPGLITKAIEMGASKYIVKPDFLVDLKQGLISIISEFENLNNR